MAYQPIENYGIIGDLHSVALVSIDGSIDFMAFPHFDSPTIFAALLDQHRGGRFQLAPVFCEDAQHKQLYLPDTNILLSRFLSGEGVAEISDFMPIENAHPCHDIVRRAKTIRGEVCFRMVCAPRFDYGRAEHRIESHDNEVVFYGEGQNQPSQLALRLRLTTPYTIEDGAVVSEFTLRAGETAAFILRTSSARRGLALGRFRLCGKRFQRNSEILAGLDQSFHLSGALARDGRPLGTYSEAPDLGSTWLLGGCPNVWLARGNWRAAQLGLSLYLDSGCFVYRVWLDAAGLYRRGGGFHEVD